jgi:nucleoside 2-deoxyribosyltransferase
VIYLASPYSHPEPCVREERFHAVCRKAAELIREGMIVFCPIAHSHPMTAFGLPVDWDYWEAFDRIFLEHCSEVWVLMLDGWRESKGVAAEVGIARELGKPVVYVDPDQMPENTQVRTGVSERNR